MQTAGLAELFDGLHLSDKLQAADKWCVQQRAADIAEFDERDIKYFVAHLDLPDRMQRRLTAALTGGPSSPSTPRTPAAAADSSQVIVEGKAYTKLEQLGSGNSQLWSVRDSHNAELVLKQCADAEAVRAEVAVRVALGWHEHHHALIKMFASEVPYIVLEKGDHSLRQLINHHKLDRAAMLKVTSDTLHGIKAMHRARFVHMDIKPENLMHVSEQRAGLVETRWKIIDCDSCREVGEPVRGFTHSYAAPELAQARLEGRSPPADFAMDIFAAGLVLLEMAAGEPLVPPPATDDEKEATLRALASAELEAKIKLRLGQSKDRALVDVLGKMLRPEPAARASAADLLLSNLLSGSITTNIRAAANKEVVGLMKSQHDESLETLSEQHEESLAALSHAEGRLGKKVREGTDELLEAGSEQHEEGLAALSHAEDRFGKKVGEGSSTMPHAAPSPSLSQGKAAGAKTAGLAELLAGLNLSGKLAEADVWCVDIGAEDVYALGKQQRGGV